jgi:hypothetical protein
MEYRLHLAEPHGDDPAWRVPETSASLALPPATC